MTLSIADIHGAIHALKNAGADTKQVPLPLLAERLGTSTVELGYYLHFAAGLQNDNCYVAGIETPSPVLQHLANKSEPSGRIASLILLTFAGLYRNGKPVSLSTIATELNIAATNVTYLCQRHQELTELKLSLFAHNKSIRGQK